MIRPVIQAPHIRATPVWRAITALAQSPRLSLLAELGQFVLTYRRVEELHLHDLATAQVIKSTQDAVAWSDNHYESITKGLLDSPRLIEVVAIGSARFAQDQYVVLDHAAVNYQRNVFDTVGATDDLDGAASLLDEQVAAYTKGINQGVRFTEHIKFLLNSNRSFADESRISDSGLIRMQNYAEFSYFAEDFVGTFTSF